MQSLRGNHPGQGRDPAVVLKLCKGEIIYTQGDGALDWFEVVSGTVRTCFLYADGHRQLTGFFYSGDVFGIETGTYQSSAEAVTPVMLRRYSRGASGEVGQPDAPPAPAALQRALRTAQACIFLLGRRTASERVAAFLLATAQRLGRDRPLQLPMSRSDIADHLGLTIHTVSRTVSEFVRRGIISLDGPQMIAIEHRDTLQRIADGDEPDEQPIRPIGGALEQHAGYAHSSGRPS
jgi:CRP/FNR family transcriptional regulator, nitrogen fixation regulation protein